VSFKSFLTYILTTIAAVLLVGCGESQQSAPAPEAKPKPQTAKVPDTIYRAAETGNIEAVKQHLATDADVNAKGRQPAWAPLLQAASGGQKEMAELLISKGADVNVLSDAGETPLDGAIAFEQPEIADLLRKYGGKTGE